MPSVIGQSRDDGVSTLVNAGLDPHAFDVASSKPVGTVTAQDPPAGKVVEKGSKVRINVSSGPADVTVPSVIGLTFDQATTSAARTRASWSRARTSTARSRRTRWSTRARAAARRRARRSSSASRRARRSRPSPTSRARTRTRRARRSRAPASRSTVQRQDVTDPGLDGIVLSQSPTPNSKAKQGSTVTIVVGQLHGDRAAAAGDAVSGRVRVAVLLGGRSSEHDVSLASARSVIDALDPERYETVAVEIGRDGRWELGTGGNGSVAETLPVPTSKVPATLGEVDVVFPVLHGPFGEDGTVQGLLELAGVPYVGAGVLGSALAMDKDVFKAVMRDRGIPVTRNITLRAGRGPGEPVRLPGLRQAGAARLLGRDLEGARRRRARRRGRARLRARREGARRGVRRRRRGRVRRARQRAARWRRCPARSSRTASRAPTGTTTRPSTTRAGWS